MRICIIGKFPPIQGGVGVRTYRTAHALAARGHEVHVVTNAKEVQPPFRMYMRPEDWRRCEAGYGTGSVTVHWTDPADRSQSYVPMASPFVSKLSTIAARAHSERPFEVIYSHYMEPYGVAAHLASQMTGVPHVVRMAGSDAGRLWHHPQFEALYDHVLRTARVVIAAGTVARARHRARCPRSSHRIRRRVCRAGRFHSRRSCPRSRSRCEPRSAPIPPSATWSGGISPVGDLISACTESWARARARSRCSLRCGDSRTPARTSASSPSLMGLRQIERTFRARARRLGVADRILQLPFLPHWRVPEFLRGCLAVCCLEQDFPIGFHSPLIASEVLLCGTCLVASTELIGKLPGYGRLPHGWGCVAVEDVTDIDGLASQLAAIAKDPVPAAVVGARGRAFACELQQQANFPHRLESILQSAAVGEVASASDGGATTTAAQPMQHRSFALTSLAEVELEKEVHPKQRASDGSDRAIDLAWARDVLLRVRRGVKEGRRNLGALAMAVQVEVAIAEAESEIALDQELDPLFRLHMKRWAMGDGDLRALVPVREPDARILEFDFDVSRFIGVRAPEKIPPSPGRGRSYIVAFARPDGHKRPPLVVDSTTARILQLSDGTRTASNLMLQLSEECGTSKDDLDWIERLFVEGLLRLEDRHAGIETALRVDAGTGDALGNAR